MIGTSADDIVDLSAPTTARARDLRAPSSRRDNSNVSPLTDPCKSHAGALGRAGGGAVRRRGARDQPVRPPLLGDGDAAHPDAAVRPEGVRRRAAAVEAGVGVGLRRVRDGGARVVPLPRHGRAPQLRHRRLPRRGGAALAHPHVRQRRVVADDPAGVRCARAAARTAPRAAARPPVRAPTRLRPTVCPPTRAECDVAKYKRAACTADNCDALEAIAPRSSTRRRTGSACRRARSARG